MKLEKYNKNAPRAVRSSVLPYVKHDDKIYFLLGVYEKNNDITDIGGGVKANENNIEGALREFLEETKGVIKLDSNSLEKSLFFHNNESRNKSMSCFYTEVPIMYYKFINHINKLFKQKKMEGKKYNEISEFRWFSSEEFLKLLTNKHDKKMWSKVRNFHKNLNVNKTVEILKNK